MNKHHFRKLATGIGAAALMATSLAVSASAAVPQAHSEGFSYGNGTYAGDGWAGFSISYTYQDTSTLAKLLLEVDINGGTLIPNDQKKFNAVRGCTASTTVITCEFKTVRTNDTFSFVFAVAPNAGATEVRLKGGWSTTGYVTGGNNSHGDAWDLCNDGQAGCQVVDPDLANPPAVLNELVSTLNGDENYAAGFGNPSLSTKTANNGQAASLFGLPGGKYASVNDNGGINTLNPDFPAIQISVNDGAAATFQLVIVYPKGTTAPRSFVHDYDNSQLDPAIFDGSDTYGACQGKTRVDCFVWSNKTSTVTLYLRHNGTLRRSG